MIDFSDNDIRKLDGFPYFCRLKELLMHNNRIKYVLEAVKSRGMSEGVFEGVKSRRMSEVVREGVKSTGMKEGVLKGVKSRGMREGGGSIVCNLKSLGGN